MYRLTDQVRDREELRDSFHELARLVFGLDLESWRRAGYWGDRYIPYLLLAGGQAVANVSVHVMDFSLWGEPVWPVQLGTVMTRPGYRGKGLASALIEQVAGEWADQCDGFYLYAAAGAHEFYSRLGFVRAKETQFIRRAPSASGARVQKLDMDSPEDRARLLQLYKQSNPFSACAMESCEGLLMFHCGGALKENVYYIPSLEAAAVAVYSKTAMALADVFCGSHLSLEELLAALARPETRTVLLGFTPWDRSAFRSAPLEAEDAALFVRPGPEGFFARRDPGGLGFMLPLLSRG
jgi:predicted N-acetyltransferase YhbS